MLRRAIRRAFGGRAELSDQSASHEGGAVIPVRRAIISVSDKTGIEAFAARLSEAGVEIVSTGGTARLLRDAGLGVRDVSEITQFPEMMGGRVKTLHPMVHGAILADRAKDDHMAALADHGIGAIDLVVVNLYPFEATVARGAGFEEAVENIDIGGPAMLRAAAKNHAAVAVVTDTQDYETVADEIDALGGTTATTRKRLAAIAYARTAAYDAAVSGWFARAIGDEAPRRRVFAGQLLQSLRYGENPHQSAAFYSDHTARPGVATAVQVQGKELSFNNINDTDAAYELVADLDAEAGPACAIIKHANPCGVARGATLVEAYDRAYDCDRVSAFGGVIALNRPLDAAAAEAITRIFTEVVIAPGADAAARTIFAEKPNIRLLLTEGLPDPAARRLDVRQVAGGLLVQDADTLGPVGDGLRCVTAREPSAQERADLLFAWRVARHVKSNAIVYVRDGATVGIGAGQMSRVDSTRIAARKSAEMAEAIGLERPMTEGAVVASDAFFPFADGLIAAADAGATAIIQPGGSMRDAEVIEAANTRGLAMLFTGRRHFRH